MIVQLQRAEAFALLCFIWSDTILSHYLTVQSVPPRNMNP